MTLDPDPRYVEPDEPPVIVTRPPLLWPLLAVTGFGVALVLGFILGVDYARAAASGDVAPGASANDERDQRLGYSEPCSEARLSLPSGRSSTDLADGVICELRPGLPSTACDPVRSGPRAVAVASCDALGMPEKAVDGAALGGCVAIVVGNRPDEQVGGVAAGRVVAAMADGSASQVSVADPRQRQGEPMGVDQSVAVTDLPVALGDGCTGPGPTGVGSSGAVNLSPEPAGDIGVGGHDNAMVPVTGIASWYRAAGFIAAAGPGLRHGNWRGSHLVVSANGRALTVELADWCLCPHGRLIDLSDDAFARLAPLSRGLVRVTIAGAGPAPTLPATDR